VKNGGLRNCGVREAGLGISQRTSPPKAWKPSGSIEKLWAEQSRSGALAAFLFKQERDEGVASTRPLGFSTEPDGF
jgi:hypothetical protein